MEDLVKIAQYVSSYVEGVRRGIDKCASMLPIMTQQHIEKLASERLNSSKDAFLGAIKSSMEDYVLVIELDEDDWLANAVESGADPFNMKKGLLNSPKAKLGKKDKYGMSYKYIRIPIGKKKDGPGGGTEKSQNLQKKINDVMMKPQLGMSKLKRQVDGSVIESQKVMTSDPDLGGLYKVRKFGSAEDYHQKKSKPKWNLVMFRTVTENPSAKAKWDHPGIKPANIFKDTQSWLNTNIDGMLDTFIETELDKLKD